MKTTPQIEVGFAVRSTKDIALAIGGYAPSQNTTASDLNDNVQGYWTQMDDSDNEQLCTIIPYGDSISGTFIDVSNDEEYGLTATNFVYDGFVGGRPIHRPHAQ